MVAAVVAAAAAPAVHIGRYTEDCMVWGQGPLWVLQTADDQAPRYTHTPTNWRKAGHPRSIRRQH